MTNNENQYTIYIRSTKESIPVSKEEFGATTMTSISTASVSRGTVAACVPQASGSPAIWTV